MKYQNQQGVIIETHKKMEESFLKKKKQAESSQEVESPKASSSIQSANSDELHINIIHLNKAFGGYGS